MLSVREEEIINYLNYRDPCVYVCIYMYKNVYIYTQVSVYTYIYTHKSVYFLNMCVYMYVYTLTHLYREVYIFPFHITIKVVLKKLFCKSFNEINLKLLKLMV